MAWQLQTMMVIMILDVFIVANAVENPNNPSSFSRLLRNNNDGSFTDVYQILLDWLIYLP